ncbi:hypothetical protein SAMN02745866_00320 [Alteromonadaceae bacterium Bs31]|nr:hypothetical protein SAMN02745866_00320 [Alteromonadaceae bacterium Bs31]
MDNIIRKKIEIIIELHDAIFPIAQEDLYESEDAKMWDGYVEPVLKLHEAIDSAFRFNKNIQPVDVSKSYEAGGVEKLNANEVGFVFRDILMNEKCNLGLFADVIADGRVTRLVNRLKEIVLNQC